MADNIIQRSHRQDDSRFGNDDPLMELSRIMGTPDEGHDAASNDAFALDLERELMGGFDEPAPVQSAAKVPDHQQQADDDRHAVDDFQEAIERELASDPNYGRHEAASGPLTAYAEPDYADYEPDLSYADNEAGEGRSVVDAPSMSLEDELENLLAGSPQPVVQRSATASWGYGSQAQMTGRAEHPAPSIARAMSYQQPAAHQPAPEPAVYRAPEPVAYNAPEPTQQSYEATDEQPQTADDEFDSEALMAAFDDFDVSAEAEEEVAESQPVFPLYQAVEPAAEVAPVREQLEVPVAMPVASAPKLPEVHDLHDYADELDRAASAIDAAPDVDTISVTENRVDFTEALDLPEVHYEDDAPEHHALGELESEFAEVFGSIEAEEVRSSQSVAEEPAAKAEPEEDEYADIFADVFGNKAEQGQYSPAGYAAAAGVAAMGAAAAGARQHHTTPAYGPEDDNDFGYDPRRDNVDIAATPYGEKQAKRRSSLFVPGVAAAVVLVAVAGAVAYKWTGGAGGDPVVIMADKTPIKVQPETTSTAIVPNQDKAVYDKDATAAPTAPKQDQLVTTREDPVDLAADEDAEDPATDKVDARVDPAEQDTAANDQQPAANTNTLAPRKVQTMVVKPDGTMVASIPQNDQALSSGPAAAPVDRPAAAAVANDAPTAPQMADTSGDDAIGDLVESNDAPAAPAQAAAPEPAKPAKAPVAAKVAPKAVETKKITQETVASVSAAPRNAPVVDRPADQPVDIVDRVPPKNAAGQQVASAAPAAGSYLIQIASQPNVEGAQKTYASLSQKYAGVIGGRGVDIKQAEIAGKGTFFRVRIPAGSKADAINLCTKYKSAGGSCFVTQ
ncbi:SPOR domain-containing protein [Phyllobacterium sp. SYP-B3895]|uniref:SPOR domain-containing protein n=1 Tax=Phyllobacterium sp. SYP-B3895 TaxID=2663240 RepID=UPI0015625BE2|nr:SPOR domain-containing protein [Phyllobacterium sp. SYP-B3895]